MVRKENKNLLSLKLKKCATQKKSMFKLKYQTIMLENN